MFREMKFLKLACYLYSVVCCCGVYKCNRDCLQRGLTGAKIVRTICIQKVSACIEKYTHGEEVSLAECVFKINRNQFLLLSDPYRYACHICGSNEVFVSLSAQQVRVVYFFLYIAGQSQVNESVDVRHD
jgi:hypothetical protein